MTTPKPKPNLLEKKFFITKDNKEEEVTVSIEQDSDEISDQIAGQIMNLADKIQDKMELLGGKFIVTNIKVKIDGLFSVTKTSNKVLIVSLKGTKDEQTIGTSIEFEGVRIEDET